MFLVFHNCLLNLYTLLPTVMPEQQIPYFTALRVTSFFTQRFFASCFVLNFGYVPLCESLLLYSYQYAFTCTGQKYSYNNRYCPDEGFVLSCVPITYSFLLPFEECFSSPLLYFLLNVLFNLLARNIESLT